jgi:hypothetical protein
MTEPLRLNPRQSDLLLGVETQGRHMMIMPVHMPQAIIGGMLGKMLWETADVWILSASPSTPLSTIARLLGALIVDAEEHFMQAEAIPRRPAAAMLLGNGELRRGRGRRVAPWIQDEIVRVARILSEEHSTYLEAVADALNGRGETFGPFPADFNLKDQHGHGRFGPAPPPIAVDVSKSERLKPGVKWWHLVSSDYRRNRYMKHLSEDQLARRIEDIMANLHSVDRVGRVSLIGGDATSHTLQMRFQELIEEMNLRHGPYPAGWQKGFVDWTRMPGSLQRQQLERDLELGDVPSHTARILVKYGLRQYLEEAYREGKIRIAPASSYSDPSLNAAVKDNELQAEFDFDPTFLGAYSAVDERSPAHNTSGRMIVRQQMLTNYYVYCLSDQFSDRLLLDFEADSALIIKDVDAFIRRIDEALLRQLPGWKSKVAFVEYYDPLSITPEEVDVLMWKHFRYAYQGEARLAWLPPESRGPLYPRVVQLGSLADIAELRIATLRRSSRISTE